MKYILILTILFTFPAWVNAATWCEWSGAEGINCQSDTKGYIRTAEGLPVGISASGLNPRGWYELTTTQPTIDRETQAIDAEIWAFADNTISLTYSIRSLTETELDQREAGALSFEMFKILQWFAAEGYIVPSTAPAGIRDAYLARERLEEPD